MHGPRIFFSDIAKRKWLPCLSGQMLFSFFIADDESITIGVFPQPGDLLPLQIRQRRLCIRIIKTLAAALFLHVLFPLVIQLEAHGIPQLELAFPRHIAVP